MENCDNKGTLPASRENMELINSPEDVRCNKGDLLKFSSFPSIKLEDTEAFGNYLSIESIKKEENDDLHNVFIESETNDPAIKIEPERNDFENKNFSNINNKDVKCVLDPSFKDINKFDKESKFEEWKLKSEEVDIQEEYLEQTDIRMLPKSFTRKEPKVCIIENVHQEIKQRNLRKHEKVNLFKCDQCDYQTLLKYNFKVHLLRHENSEDVKKFKCDQCDYQTPLKVTLKRNLLRHENPEDVEKFKCDQCDYQTPRKDFIKKHLLLHRNPEDVKKFKCDQCDYQAIRKSELNVHLLRHKNPKDVKKFKCDQCGYQTLLKVNLKRHLLRHKNPEDVEKFKCDQCDYQTPRKDNLKMHLLRHKNPEDVEKLKCDQCDYQTLYKSNLKKHLLRHKNSEDVKTFKIIRLFVKAV